MINWCAMNSPQTIVIFTVYLFHPVDLNDSPVKRKTNPPKHFLAINK